MTLTASAMTSAGPLLANSGRYRPTGSRSAEVPCVSSERTVRERCLDGNSVCAFVVEPISGSFQLTNQAIDS
jgi:hypothetical protein